MDLAVLILLANVAASDTTVGEPVEQMCLANGRSYHQGEVACLELPCMQPYLARCGMVLNNSSWRKIQDSCPISFLVEPEGGEGDAGAAASRP